MARLIATFTRSAGPARVVGSRTTRKVVCSRPPLTGLTGMGAARPHLSLVPASAAPSPGCTSPKCRLPACSHGLCAHCMAVQQAALLLYDALVARAMARLEIDHPGLERAARIALGLTPPEHERPTPATTETLASSRRVPADPHPWTLLDAQIGLLERFVAELRTATDDQGRR